MSKFGNRVLGFFGLSSGGGGTPIPQNLQQTLDTGNISDIPITLDDGNGDVMALSFGQIAGRLDNDTATSFSLQKELNVFTNGDYEGRQLTDGFVFTYQSKTIRLRAVNYANVPTIEFPDNIDSKLEIQNTNYGGEISTLSSDYVIDSTFESTIFLMAQGDQNENGYLVDMQFADGLTMYFCFNGAYPTTGLFHFSSTLSGASISGTEFYSSASAGLLIVTRVGDVFYMSKTV